MKTFSAQQTADAEAHFARTECTFLKGVVDVEGLPAPDRPEIAFAGRSNVGKSSLFNALMARRDLARTSSTPGRTQELNFFAFADEAYFVDLPGYGFAKAPKAKVDQWNALIRNYLRGRPSLVRVFLLIDARRGMMPVDAEIARLLDASAVPYQGVLTKVDKLKDAGRARVFAQTAAQLMAHPAAYPLLLETSAEKRTGMDVLRAQVMSLIAPERFGVEPQGDDVAALAEAQRSAAGMASPSDR